MHRSAVVCRVATKSLVPGAWWRDATAHLPLSTRAQSTRHHPSLPEPQEIRVGDDYVLKYIDLKSPLPVMEPRPTIVLVHGSPGSYQDYKYLIPLLQDHARVIGINLPGNGDSVVLDQRNFYERIRAIHLAHAAHVALAQICSGDENVFVVGHSFGGHATINMAALNEMSQAESQRVNIRGVGFLASAGLRLHRALESGNLGLYYGMLKSDYRLVEAIGRVATRALFTKVWGFPSSASTDHYVAGLVRCASTDFRVVKDHVAQIRHLPAFFAWAKDDLFIQEQVFQELSDEFAPGPRLTFDKGGHNIQKTKADFLAAELIQWMKAVTQGYPATQP